MEGKKILHGIDLEIKPGETHVIMGPNGSGKSTLSSTLMGHPAAKVTGGEAAFMGENLLEMAPEIRAQKGLFLGFQYPKEIPGVSLASFLRAALAAQNPNKKQLPLYKFKNELQEKMNLVALPFNFMDRFTNEGFSGGEKKKAEILQLAVLEPKLAILDEIDSGLDIDSLKTICEALMTIKKPEQSLLLITHYARMLKFLKPDFVHVLIDGKIVLSGGHELAELLEEKGYDAVREQVGIKKSSPFKLLEPNV